MGRFRRLFGDRAGLVEAREVHTRRRDERDELAKELHRLEHELVRSARRHALHPIHEPAIRQLAQSGDREGSSRAVDAEALDPLPVLAVKVGVRVQGEAVKEGVSPRGLGQSVSRRCR